MRSAVAAAVMALACGWAATPSHAAQKYLQMCDASAAVAVDDGHFLVAGDENETVRLYRNTGKAELPVTTFDFAGRLRDNPDRETDIEAAARIGNRIFWITSHGRNGKGRLRPNRYRLFATDLDVTSDGLKLTWLGRYDRLVDDLLDEAAWQGPSGEATRTIIEKLRKATRLNKKRVKKLAPKRQGMNIEGLAATPSGTGLLIGFRNPVPDGKALVVFLANPKELVTRPEARARFIGLAELDLGGLGIRSIEYTPAIQGYLVLAGPSGDGGPFRIYKWSGSRDAAPVELYSLKTQKGRNPEALVIYRGSPRVQILMDEGSFLFDGTRCKDRRTKHQRFSDDWVEVN